MLYVLIAVFVVLLSFNVLLLRLLRSRTDTDVNVNAEPAESTADLRNEIAELNKRFGEQEAAHRAKLATVQQQAIIDMQQMRSELELEFASRKRAAAKDTAARSRVALVAKIAEHMTPLLAGFPYNPKDARHWGEIFDFLVFDGLEDGEIRRVVFLEVKTRRSGSRVTNPREKLLKAAIDAGRVSYEVFVPDTAKAKELDD